jgi:hypothetical protein
MTTREIPSSPRLDFGLALLQSRRQDRRKERQRLTATTDHYVRLHPPPLLLAMSLQHTRMLTTLLPFASSSLDLYVNDPALLNVHPAGEEAEQA